MNQPVVIKGNKSGLIVHLDDQMEFSELKEKVEEKFTSSSDFLGAAQIALSFEGRKLSEDQKYELMECIREHSQLDIVCLIDDDAQKEAYFTKTLEEKLTALNTNSGQFYKGTLRSGQVLECESSVVIVGDVNPGAKIVARGNIVVLGSLDGNAYAGAAGNSESFVAALHMNPIQIKIADVIGRSEDKSPLERLRGRKKQLAPQVAYIKEEAICIDVMKNGMFENFY